MNLTVCTPSNDRVALVTGADENYFWLIVSAIQSLSASRSCFHFDIVVLDFGLSREQIAILERDHQVTVVDPAWKADVPIHLRTKRNLAFATRCTIPQVVPGYDIYVWFDSDSWVQDDRFIEPFLAAARRKHLAIVREDQKPYPFDWRLIKWNLGNQILGFGPVHGVQTFRSPFINSGVFAVGGKHRLWDAWRLRFEKAVARSGKIIMDQHSLRATILLDAIPTEYLPSRYNWICSRVQPFFDCERNLFCLPYAPYESIAVMHLAGQAKKVEYDLPCVGGGSIRKKLLFPSRSPISVEPK